MDRAKHTLKYIVHAIYISIFPALLLIFALPAAAAEHTHTWEVSVSKYSTVASTGTAVCRCRTCGKTKEQSTEAIALSDSVSVKNSSTLASTSIRFPKINSILYQGREAVRIYMPNPGDLYIRATDRSNITSIKLYKTPTFSDAGTSIALSEKMLTLDKGYYYLKVVRKAGMSSSGQPYYYAQAGFTLKMRYRRENVLNVSDITKGHSTKAQTVRISVTQTGTGALSYSSDTSSVKVSSKGVVTIAAGFSGIARITVHSAATSCYKSASKKLTLKVKTPKTSLTALRGLTGDRLKISWATKSGVSGYQIQYSTNKEFGTDRVTRTVKGGSTASYVTATLKGDKKYYFRIRTYKDIGTDRIYSNWSSVQSRVARMQILMIGNSFTLYHDLYLKLANKLGADVVESVEKGCTLADHCKETTDVGSLTQLHLKKKWDYVVIQDYSTRSYLCPDYFFNCVSILCKKAKAAGAQPILYATWAYQPESEIMQKQTLSYHQMYEAIRDAYHSAAVRCGAWEAQVGKAFYDQGGKASLYDPDGKHPSKEGSKLAAEVIGNVILAHE